MKMAEQRNGLLLLAWATCFLLACIFSGCAGDVPDGVVYTDLHKTVKKGDSATLKCEFRGVPIAVYWRKEIGQGQWEDLIVWVEETTLSGSCLADEFCEMNQDFSLIINNVQIADRGRYMCRISNYLGILIHNYTDMNTYAPPEEPYPNIEECTSAQNPNSSQMCSIPAGNTPMDITCSASNYFPDLNLFFLHGSVKISNTDSDEWTIEDGTKNKYISVKGSASEKPYVCVASDIPGSTEERTATVFLRPPTFSTPSAPDMSSYPSQTTIASDERTDPVGGAKPAKIVVPVVIIILAGGAMLIVYYWLKRRRGVPDCGKKDVEETQAEGAHASGEEDVEETRPMLEQTIKVHVEGVISFYELWSLAYNTPKEDMGKVCAALMGLGMKISKKQMRSEQVYDSLCDWKKAVKPPEQAQKFRDALQSAKLGNIWQQIYEKRQQATASVSEGILRQILLDLGSSRKIKKFLDKLISSEETKVNIREDATVPDTQVNLDNVQKNTKMASVKKLGVGGEDNVSNSGNYSAADAEKNDVVREAMKILREWNKGPFSENPYVLLSLALEKAGFCHISRTIFDGILSFYELRSLLYNMETPDMNKLHTLIKELGEVEDVKASLGPQQIYEALCRWKEKHNKGDRSKILRDALERAGLSEAWFKIPETRKDTARVSEGTLKHILLEIREPIKIQQFISKLVPGAVRHQNALDDKGVIQQAMDTLRKWSKGQFDENPMILLSRALEKGGCNPVDRTFFYGKISYFELWSLVHAYKDDMKTLCHALRALGIQDVHNTNTLNRVYVLLSEWKNKHHAYDQLLALKVLLFEDGLLKFREDLEERRCTTNAKISNDTLQHILWHVKEPKKINNFLVELIQDLQEPCLDVAKPAKDIITAALVKLKQWQEGMSDENQVVQASLALERAKCTPVDRTFFKVPTYLQEPIRGLEVQVFVHKLTSRHCERLANGLPKIDEKRLLEILDENNDLLFDTKSMVSDWIANVECSNYEKRCRLENAALNIGRHDMTDLFRTVAYRQETEEALAKPHPASQHFNAHSIFDDDLISVAKLMSCLDAEIMSIFCTSVGISNQVKEAFKHHPVEEVLRKWRDENLTSKSPNRYLESVFSQITELMGDKTYVKYVTDGELAFIEKQFQTVDKKERLLSGLQIHRNKKGKWIMKLKGINQKEEISVSDRKEEETGIGTVKVQNEAGKEESGAGREGGGAGKEEDGAKKEEDGAGKRGDETGKDGSGAEKEEDKAGGDEAGKMGDGAGREGDEAGKEGDKAETYVLNVKDRGVEAVFIDLLKEWRNRRGEKSCRKKLRTVLKTVGVEECIVNKRPRKYMYKAELVQVAFNILMRDVLPVIHALGIDQMKAKKYRRQNPDLEKGSLSLLIQLCPETKQVQAYSRRDFLPVLLKFGYVDAARSLYLDYEMSLCELSSIVSNIDEAKFKSFITQLGFSSDELAECNGTDEEAYRIEVMRIWKSKIRPVPYHYRMHIVTALQTIGSWDLVGEVLSGHHRGSAAIDDVIGAICIRLDKEQARRLCKLLKVKHDEEQKKSTTKVVNWVSKWMDEYDPSSKVRKGKSWDKFQPRKHMNNELVKAGCYELANEIMRLEFSRV